jgi:cytochrome P450
VITGGRAAALVAARPPGPRGRPLVGTLYDYEKDPVGYLTSCRDAYGDIFSLTPYHVVLCRPDWSHRVFARTNREFRFASHEKGRRESFMTRQVASWMLARRSAGWHRIEAGKTAAVMRDRLRDALTRMAALPVAGVADCQRAAADAALHIFVSDIDENLRQLVIDSASTVPAITSSSLTLPRWASPGRRRFDRAADTLIDELSHRARTWRGPEPTDMLGLLCQVEDRFTSVQVAQFLASVMTNVYAVAGAALSWLLVTAARYPELTTAHLADAFVKETLRLHPPIWGVGREVLQPAEFGGYTLRPGTTVMMSTRLMHLDQRWWREDPSAFRPERWLDPARPPHETHAYIPYGAGPRVCVGAQIAQSILTQAFEVLASSWKVAISPHVPKAPPAAVVVPDPLRITLTPR